MATIQPNYLDSVSAPTSISITDEIAANEMYLLKDARSISAVLEGRRAPGNIEDPELTTEYKDKDGDGDSIPDSWDKTPGKSRSQLGAESHKLGAFTKASQKNSTQFITQTMAKKVLNAIGSEIAFGTIRPSDPLSGKGKKRKKSENPEDEENEKEGILGISKTE